MIDSCLTSNKQSISAIFRMRKTNSTIYKIQIKKRQEWAKSSYGYNVPVLCRNLHMQEHGAWYSPIMLPGMNHWSGFSYYNLTTPKQEGFPPSSTWNLKINLDSSLNFTVVFQKSVPLIEKKKRKKKDTEVFIVLIGPVTISYLYLRKV